MAHWFDHSLVLASDYRVPEPARVWPMLRREEAALGELGAHHVLVYTSTAEPQRMLVLMALHSREPVRDVLRSPVILDWFDDFGVQDIPAVFAGELAERLDFDAGEAPEAPQAVAVVITPVDDVAHLVGHINAPDFLAAGIRKMLIFRAFDDPNEVMLLFGLQDEASAARWLARSEATSEWLRKTGIGAYPPLFVGRYRDMMRVEGPR
ncbi:MAG: fatty-acid--CoA ligase [Mycobacterium sp.]